MISGNKPGGKPRRSGYWDMKDTTDDYRSIDVRHWKREGLLTSDQSFTWQWLSHYKVVASLCVHTEPDQVILSYRHRSGDQDWKQERYPSVSTGQPVRLAGSALGFDVRPGVAEGRSPYPTVAVSLPVVTAADWSIPVSGKPAMRRLTAQYHA